MAELLTYETIKKDLAIHVGAMVPWRFTWKAGGFRVPFNGNEKLIFTWGKTGSLTLSAGSGITYETVDGLVNARLVARLTNAQTRLLPKGLLTSYEMQTGVAEQERALFMGRVLVEGGANPDA